MFVILAVDAFSEERITANVLKQILKRKDVVLDIRIKDAPKESLVLYEKGKVVDYFLMVIQGHVDVTVGMEEFTFPQGEFFIFVILKIEKDKCMVLKCYYVIFGSFTGEI